MCVHVYLCVCIYQSILGHSSGQLPAILLLMSWIKTPLTCARQSKKHLAGKHAKAAQNAYFTNMNLSVDTAFIFNTYPPKTETHVQQSCQLSYMEKKRLLNGCF